MCWTKGEKNMEVIKKWKLQLFADGDDAGTEGNGTEPAEPNKREITEESRATALTTS